METANRPISLFWRNSGRKTASHFSWNFSRLGSLSMPEAFFLMRCLAVVAVVRLGLTLSSYNYVRGRVMRLEATGDAGIGDLRRVAWGVAAAARLVPGASCLTQALAGQYLLARQGKASKITIGIERDSGPRLKAHAWLMSGDHIVLGGSINGFTHLVDHGS
ncbi:lasso peptide biosynthesis B2 protein [Mesorhizobium sp. CU2]|nr:lasso peptide biosynthesis B2 protein [Mesorhizobium sp. CU3]TPO06220.1 lasso peptide biosynthesis B2 protein [Mesorhizobium sp. CU2]